MPSLAIAVATANTFTAIATGYYCPVQTGTPLLCPAASYCPISTGTSPPLCPIGTFGTVTGAIDAATACTPCTEGWYCNSLGTTAAARLPCPAGYYCPIYVQRLVCAVAHAALRSAWRLPLGSGTTTPCSAGTYSNALSQWSVAACTVCPAGRACPSGSAGTLACSAGFYCPTGTPAVNTYPCPQGTYSASTSLTDASQCLQCTAGNYCVQGSSAQIPCPAGTYSNAVGVVSQSGCTQCDAGKACPSNGMLAPTVRYFSAQQLTVSHTLRCWSLLMPAHTARAALRCNTTHILTNTHNSCSAGYFCPTGSSSATANPCSLGTYTDSTSLVSQSQCTICPARYMCSSTPRTTAQMAPCTAGYYCPAGSSIGTACPAGESTFTLAQLSECTDCPQGSACPGPATTTDSLCAAGYYCPTKTGSATSNPCPAGTYSSSTSLYSVQQCIVCPAGSYCAQRVQRARQLLQQGYCSVATELCRDQFHCV
eukprot:21268-Heterococcus_DN1.PRE.5